MNDDRMVRLSEVAAKFALPDQHPDVPTYACRDCEDTGFIVVPCRQKGCIAYPMRTHNEFHRLVRCCLSCETGIASEAGVWFRFLWDRDRSGKPKLRTDRLPKFREAMKRHGPAAARVELALARITERHKAGQMEGTESWTATSATVTPIRA